MALTADNSRCARCGKPFTCGMVAGAAKCWCAELPAVEPVPGEGCLCRDCLEAKAKAEPPMNAEGRR
jgi:hypothetical protein